MNREGAKNAKTMFCDPLLRVLGVFAVVLLAAPVSAAADGYGKGEAKPRRSGFAIGLGLGPALYMGSGELDSKKGVGGDLNLRVGTSAGPRFLWLLEAQIGGYLVEVTNLELMEKETIFNSHFTLTLGGQFYVREALWLRGGLGLAAFREQEGRNGPTVEGSPREGLAVIAGGGYDLFRRGIFAFDIEVATTGAIFGDAFIAHSSLLLGVVWY
jgi:hypothetical protein